jgi:hypothetical protein
MVRGPLQLPDAMRVSVSETTPTEDQLLAFLDGPMHVERDEHEPLTRWVAAAKALHDSGQMKATPRDQWPRPDPTGMRIVTPSGETLASVSLGMEQEAENRIIQTSGFINPKTNALYVAKVLLPTSFDEGNGSPFQPNLSNILEVKGPVQLPENCRLPARDRGSYDLFRLGLYAMMTGGIGMMGGVPG